MRMGVVALVLASLAASSSVLAAWTEPPAVCALPPPGTARFRSRPAVDIDRCVIFGARPAPVRAVNAGVVLYGLGTCPAGALEAYHGSVYRHADGGIDWACWSSPPDGAAAVGPCVVCY